MRVRELGTRPAPASIREIFSRLVRGHGPTTHVERRQIPYWQERGWTHEGNHYAGSYQTLYAAFRGWIEEERSGRFTFLIYNPSREIQNCNHWSCFVPRGNDWHMIHMARRPRDVSSGIITVERLISEAYQ